MHDPNNFTISEGIIEFRLNREIYSKEMIRNAINSIRDTYRFKYSIGEGKGYWIINIKVDREINTKRVAFDFNDALIASVKLVL